MNAPLIAWSEVPEPLTTLLPRLRTQLLRAIDLLGARRIEVSPESRLRIAADVLRAIQLVASGKRAPEALRDLEAAVVTAINFRDIADTLPDERVASIRRELAIAVSGDLHGPAVGRRPWQFESQHLVGAALRLADMPPVYSSVSGKAGKAPDLRVEIGGSLYGVEVKRPEAINALEGRLKDACGQLRPTGRAGVVALDVTDLLRERGGLSLAAAVKTVNVQVDRLILRESMEGYREGFEPISCAFVFARAPGIRFDTEPSLLTVEHAAACSIFGTEESLAIGGLFQAAFAKGFGQTGFGGRST